MRARAWAMLTLVALALAWLSWARPMVEGDTLSEKATPDSFWVIRNALATLGYGDVRATTTTITWVQPWIFPHEPPAIGVPRMLATPPRYAAIFESRPAAGWVLAPFVAAFGRDGVVVHTVLLLAAVLVAVAAVTWALVEVPRRSYAVVAPLAAMVAATLLPSGFWGSKILFEAGTYLSVLLLVLIALCSDAQARPRAWLAGAAAVVAFVGCAYRASYVAPVAAVLVAWVVVRRLLRRDPVSSWWLPVTATLLGVAAWFVVSGLERWPGLQETLQDTFTAHFRRPDVPDPVAQWWALLRASASTWGSGLLTAPWGFVLAVVACLYLVVRLRWLAVPVLTPVAAAVVNVGVHPLVTQSGRLVSPVWVSVAIAVGLAALQLADTVVRRRAVTAPDVAADPS